MTTNRHLASPKTKHQNRNQIAKTLTTTVMMILTMTATTNSPTAMTKKSPTSTSLKTNWSKLEKKKRSQVINQKRRRQIPLKSLEANQASPKSLQIRACRTSLQSRTCKDWSTRNSTSSSKQTSTVYLMILMRLPRVYQLNSKRKKIGAKSANWRSRSQIWSSSSSRTRSSRAVTVSPKDVRLVRTWIFPDGMQLRLTLMKPRRRPSQGTSKSESPAVILALVSLKKLHRQVTKKSRLSTIRSK